MKPSLALGMLLLALPAWPDAMFHGGPTHAGVYAQPGPTHEPAVRWTFDTGAPVVASPAVEGEAVYVASLGGRIYALDRASGHERWRFQSRGPIASSPAVAGGIVYFVSALGALAALDAATGQPRWVAAVGPERHFEARSLHGYGPAAQTVPDAWDVFTSAPTVVDGRVYFGGGDGNVYAVDAQSGLIQWQFATGEVVHASPAVAQRTVYVGSWNGVFYAIDADTGQLRWSFRAGEDPAQHNQVGFQSSASVVDGTVYVGSRDAHLYALDAATGRKRWEYPTSKSWVNATPAVRDGLVWAATSDSSRVFAVDARTGRLRLNVDARAYVFSSVALAGALAYVGSHNGRLYAIDARTGELAWWFLTEGARHDPLGVADKDGRLVAEAFRGTFGDFEDMYLDYYRFTTVGGILASPVIADGVLYVASLDGRLYALE
ncbi:MAG: PQQ-binding-like beta-propeller repeat protein [Proteobacteria bacterium]|nr:PQQ-binding-like beta-propeller repeat protein [Pseudomonadota bacterium]